MGIPALDCLIIFGLAPDPGQLLHTAHFEWMTTSGGRPRATEPLARYSVAKISRAGHHPFVQCGWWHSALDEKGARSRKASRQLMLFPSVPCHSPRPTRIDEAFCCGLSLGVPVEGACSWGRLGCELKLPRHSISRRLLLGISRRKANEARGRKVVRSNKSRSWSSPRWKCNTVLGISLESCRLTGSRAKPGIPRSLVGRLFLGLADIARESKVRRRGSRN
jgi:hypothetical protein